MRDEASRDIQVERADLEARRTELQRQQNILRDNLAAVAERFKTARDEVVNQFLAVAPLFASMNLIQPSVARGMCVNRRRRYASSRSSSCPRSFRGSNAQDEPTISESEFFNRFIRHVEASGYVYRRLEIVAFHLSIKCCDLTILGGTSGTGKSSLPRLYAKALAGSDPRRARAISVRGRESVVARCP